MLELRRKSVQLVVSKINFRGYVKSDWAYPMVTPDGVIIMSTIEAHEGCDIVVTDIPNAFLNTNYSEKLSCF